MSLNENLAFLDGNLFIIKPKKILQQRIHNFLSCWFKEGSNIIPALSPLSRLRGRRDGFYSFDGRCDGVNRTVFEKSL